MMQLVNVMQLVNDELHQARNAFRRTPDDLPKGVSPEAAKVALKSSKYALLKPEDKLTEQQREKLTEVESRAPKLAFMNASKEAFQELFKLEESTAALLDLLD